MCHLLGLKMIILCFKFSNNFCTATWGPYSEHVKEGYGLRHDKNVLFLFYEEINKVKY